MTETSDRNGNPIYLFDWVIVRFNDCSVFIYGQVYSIDSVSVWIKNHMYASEKEFNIRYIEKLPYDRKEREELLMLLKLES